MDSPTCNYRDLAFSRAYQQAATFLLQMFFSNGCGESHTSIQGRVEVEWLERDGLG